MKITTVGDPVLRERTLPISREELRSPGVQRLIDELIETRRGAGGAGLAAPQVSISKRIAIVEVDDATRRRYPYKPLVPLRVIVNPVIEPLSEEKLLINEGCLSVPGLRGDVPRFTHDRRALFDRNGSAARGGRSSGLTAGTVQHEVDHLDGVLFLDRAGPAVVVTWEQFERHGMSAFLERIAPYT